MPLALTRSAEATIETCKQHRQSDHVHLRCWTIARPHRSVLSLSLRKLFCELGSAGEMVEVIVAIMGLPCQQPAERAS